MDDATDRSRNALWPLPKLRVGASTLGVVLLALTAACSGQNCDCAGFDQQPFPEEHYDKSVERSGQIRISDTGLAFFDKQIPNLLQEIRPDGLNFCVPKDTSSNPALCVEGQCDNGNAGCQLEMTLEDSSIETSPPETLKLHLTVGSVNETIPFNADLTLTTAKCEADLHADGQGNDQPATIDATVPVELTVDQESPTNNLTVHVGEISANLDDLAYDISGRDGEDGIQCGVVDFGSSFVDGMLKDRVKSELNATVQEAVRGRLCEPCGSESQSCGDDAECHEFSGGDYCKRPSQDQCVAKPLGVEGRLQLGEVVSDLTESPKASVDLMARAADTAEVDSGITLGLRSAFQHDELRNCAPVDPASRPSLDAIPLSSKLTSNEQPNGDAFMVGAGFHETAVEQMLWTTWASGGLCLKVGSDFTSQLSTNALSLLLQSIGNLNSDNAPAFLKVTPQTAPEVTLGNNVITEDGDSYSLDEPLMTLNWEDLDLHFYAFVQDRYTRLFTTRMNLEVPVGLRPTDDGKLVPVTGDLEEAPKDIRVRNAGLIAEDDDTIRDLIPTLLSTALPRVTDQLSEPIDLPSFFGYEMVLEQDDITSVDNNEFIALFGNLKYVGSMQALHEGLEPSIADASVDLGPRTEAGVPRPVVTLRLRSGLGPDAPSREAPANNDGSSPSDGAPANNDGSGPSDGAPAASPANNDGSEPSAGAPAASPANNDSTPNVEYSYRVDDGFWSLFTSERPLTIQHPALALPGEHEIEVRARYADDVGHATEPVETTVRIDHRPPDLHIDRDGRTVTLLGDDAVDAESELEYRHRIVDAEGEPLGGWSRWRDDGEVELPTPTSETTTIGLEAEVRDRSGRVGSASKTFELRDEADDDSGAKGAAGPDSRATCSSSGGGALPGPFGLLAFGLLALGRIWSRRAASDDESGAESTGRSDASWRWTALLGVALVAVASVGCSPDESGKNNDDEEPTCKSEECETWETCREGSCAPIDCSGETSCPEGTHCADGTCKAGACGTAEHCDCPSDRRPVCEEQTCSCRDYCPDGCGEDEFCCYEENQCQGIPDPCNGKSCDPGYEPKVVSRGEPNSSACEVEGASCECQEKPPIDLRWYGRYASADARGDVAAVAAYNKYFGDLMVGLLDGELEPTWYTPDGVPEEGTVVAAPSGPRGGIEETGEDVGTHTSIAVDDSGALHVFYRSEENSALKYARGTPGDGGYSFATLEVDTEGTPRTTAAIVRDGVVHAVYSTADVDVTIGETDTTGSQLRHVSFPVDTGLDSLAPEPKVALESGPNSPCLGTCSGSEECFVDSKDCAEASEDCDSCNSGFACHDGSCEAVYSAPDLTDHPMATGLYPDLASTENGLAVTFYDGVDERIGYARRTDGSWGEPTFLVDETGPYSSVAVDGDDAMHLTYMDRAGQSLQYRVVGSEETETVVGGTRSSNNEHLVAQIGDGVDLWLQSDGTPRVAFQDTTTHELTTASRSDSGEWNTSTVAAPGDGENYSGAHGFYAGSLKPASDGLVEMIIDQSTTPSDAELRFHRLP